MENSVDAFFTWGNDKTRDTIEKICAEKNSRVALWKRADTLYSFIGLYQIGIYVYYYPKKCIRTDYTIKRTDGKFFGFDYLYEEENGCHRYKEFKVLNKVIEESGFLEVFDSVGNVIPIWPGGNVDKGIRAHCFDLPEIYFGSKYKEWFEVLCNIYPDAYLDSINTEEFAIDTKSFLNYMNDTNYKKYLKHAVDVIKYRKQMLEK